MFTPSSEKVRAAEAYLEKIRTRKRSWATTHPSGHTRTRKPLWRSLPKEWHAEAEAHLNRLVCKYWSEHGHGPSQHKHASLIGNVVQYILYCRMSHRKLSLLWKFWNARKVASGGANVRNPQDRTGFTPRDAKHRASQGNLQGI
jgi:hypothetical protein